MKRTAPVRWYEAGFAIGASGGKPTQRRGRPRLRAMVDHWRAGVVDGGFARAAFVGAFASQINRLKA